MSEGTWYYVENGGSSGPLARSEIERLVREGVIAANTLVWRDGLAAWEAASAHFDVPDRNSPPPIPKQPPAIPVAGAHAPWSVPARDGPPSGGPPVRSFWEAVKVCFSKYVTCSGRASRSEFWYFTLFTTLLVIVTVLIDGALFGWQNEVSPISTIASLVVLLPSLSVSVRRLHDINRTGWWAGVLYLGVLLSALALGAIGALDQTLAVSVLPLVVFLWLAYFAVLVVLLCIRGTQGANRYG